MSDAPTFEWDGRAVVFKDFTVKDLDDVRAAFGDRNALGMWTVLALSAHYADTGERVFTDAATVEASPARKASILSRMALAAMAANGMEDAAKPDAPPLA